MPIQVTCARPGCGVSFWVKPHRVADGEGVYHSSACYAAAQRRPDDDFSALSRLHALSRIDPVRGCWPWTASTREGYGRLHWRGQAYSAPRLAFYLSYGRWPTPTVRHLCEDKYPAGSIESRLCINPEHLAEGGMRAQAADMAASGHLVLGERQHCATLTDAVVLEARVRHRAAGVTYAQLAREYGVTRETITRAIKGTTWRHVSMP